MPAGTGPAPLFGVRCLSTLRPRLFAVFDVLTSGNRGEPARPRAGAFAFSLLLHLLFLALLIWGGGESAETLFQGRKEASGTGTGPNSGPAGGGGGGSELVTYVELASSPGAPPPERPSEVSPPPPPEPEPLPEPTPEPPSHSPPREAPPAPLPPAAGSLLGEVAGGSGTGTGSGTGAGTGPGAGGGSGGGSGGGIGSGTGSGTGGGGGSEGSIRPPVAAAVILPPTPPPAARGRTVTLRLTVNDAGRVTRAEVVSSSGEAAYDRRLQRTAREWKFLPARDGENRAVTANVDISFSF